MACAADHHHDPGASDRPGVPPAQAPRPGAGVRYRGRHGARVLPGGHAADDTEPEELDNAVTDDDEPRRPLAAQRREAIVALLRDQGARRIGDFGCGAGVLIKDLLADPGVERVTAVDVSARALQLAARNLRLDRWPDRQRERLNIFQTAPPARPAPAQPQEPAP